MPIIYTKAKKTVYGKNPVILRNSVNEIPSLTRTQNLSLLVNSIFKRTRIIRIIETSHYFINKMQAIRRGRFYWVW